MIKLSIIIPIYNVEPYLADCLDSVLKTKQTDYEIILVDDGSPDNSLSIAQRYAEKYPQRIRIHSGPNGGLGQARNIGIEMATGEWLLFVDSDDRLADGALEEIFSVLNKPVNMIIFDDLVVREDGSVSGRTVSMTREAGDFSIQEYPEALFSDPSACNKLYKRSLFVDNDIRFPSRVWYEDLHTTPKLLVLAQRMSYIPKAWYLYMQRGGSIMRNKTTERNLEIIDAVDDVLDWFRKKGMYEQYEKELEYLAYYNQLLTSTTRVNLIDRKSPVQARLRENFENKFPNWKENTYIQHMPAKYRFLNNLIFGGQYLMLNLVMRANAMLRH